MKIAGRNCLIPWVDLNLEPFGVTGFRSLFSNDGRLMLTAHEDSGLIQLFLMGTDTQQKAGFYQRIANEQLDNRELKW